MAKNSRKSKVSVMYPEEREGRTKDANNKLKSQVRNLRKIVKQLEIENKTLSRAFDKSCDFIQDRLKGQSLGEILDMINGEKKPKKPKKAEAFSDNCPKCENSEDEGYKTMVFEKFIIKSCTCGYRSKKAEESGEGLERS